MLIVNVGNHYYYLAKIFSRTQFKIDKISKKIYLIITIN